MEHIKIIVLFFLLLLNFIFGKECITSQNDSTSIICSENTQIITNLTYYLSKFSNITQLSLINSYLTEMPNLSNHQLIILHLDNNQIELVNRNYSTIEYLYLTLNHIYALHLTNLSYPKLKFLDLSHNPIEHITENFFSHQQFPQLKILKLTNALKHINPYLIDNRLLSFSSLKYLNEIYLDENNFEEFSCSNNITHIQWDLPLNLKKIFLGKNKLNSFDEICFLKILNLTQLDLHENSLKYFSNINFTFSYLLKIQLDSNSFNNVPSNLLYSSKQLIELNLSSNPLNFKRIKTKKQYVFPNTLKILYLNSIEHDLSCSLFENLLELQELHLVNLSIIQLKNCMFKKLTQLRMMLLGQRVELYPEIEQLKSHSLVNHRVLLNEFLMGKMLNLHNHRLKIFDEQVFRPLLTMTQFRKLDITSHSLLCNACSLRWLITFLKSQNKTEVICLDQQGKEILINTLNLLPCPSINIISTMIIIIFILISFLLFFVLCVYTYRHRKFTFSKLSSVYHMIPLRHYDGIYQSTTEDITNDNVMLVT